MMQARFATVVLSLAGLALVVVGAGCSRDGERGGDDDDTLVVQAEQTGVEAPAEEQMEGTQAEEKAELAETPEPAAEQPEEEEMTEETRVVIKTTKGDIGAKLYPDDAPKTVANFLSLAGEGYYDEMVWHRVEPGFVIQAGQGPDRPNIPDEVNRHKHRRGALAMAKLGSGAPGRLSEPDSASTQFYITLCSGERAEYLNAEYTVFGQVLEGMDVAREITTEDKIITIEVPATDA